MSYIQGIDRQQTQLLPPSVDEYVGENAPVRVIDAFVDSLDLEVMGFRMRGAVEGRPGYAPAVMLKLYMYGYLHRVRSSRRLEAETHRNLEAIWLLRGLKPDHWTIAAFRREEGKRLKGVFREFNRVCRQLELFGAELVAIDGAKFKAVNNPNRHATAEQLQELQAKVEEGIDAYLTQLDQGDSDQAGTSSALDMPDLAEKLGQLRTRQAHYQKLRETLATNGAAEVALTDSDARLQKRVGVGYNVQIAVDAKHHLIVVPEVEPDQNDLHQLHPMSVAAREELPGANFSVTADAGYHEARQLEKCAQAGIETFVPAPGRTTGQAPDGSALYPKKVFTYEADRNGYTCPAGQFLDLAYQCVRDGKTVLYYYNVGACGQCPLKAQCTNSRYRKISRLENEAFVEQQAARVGQHPEAVRQRKTIVEHVFGTLRMWGHDTFLCRGLESVRAEFNLSALAYNLRRAINVVGVTGLLSALRPTA